MPFAIKMQTHRHKHIPPRLLPLVFCASTHKLYTVHDWHLEFRYLSSAKAFGQRPHSKFVPSRFFPKKCIRNESNLPGTVHLHRLNWLTPRLISSTSLTWSHVVRLPIAVSPYQWCALTTGFAEIELDWNLLYLSCLFTTLVSNLSK